MNEELVKKLLTKVIDIDPESELSPLNPNKHPNEQLVETGREVLKESQKMEQFRNLYHMI